MSWFRSCSLQPAAPSVAATRPRPVQPLLGGHRPNEGPPDALASVMETRRGDRRFCRMAPLRPEGQKQPPEAILLPMHSPSVGHC